jgi:hypothetical protein
MFLILPLVIPVETKLWIKQNPVKSQLEIKINTVNICEFNLNTSKHNNCLF